MQKHDKMMQHVIVVRCWEHAHTHTHTRRLVVNPSPHTPPLYTTPSSPRHHCALPLLCDPDIAWALRDFDVKPTFDDDKASKDTDALDWYRLASNFLEEAQQEDMVEKGKDLRAPKCA